MRIRVRCNVCAEVVHVGGTTARLLHSDDATAGTPGLALVFRCPACRCRAEAGVHPETARVLLDAGLKVEGDPFARRGHLRTPRPGAPALDVDDLVDFVHALDREPSEIFAELERLVADARATPEQRDRT